MPKPLTCSALASFALAALALFLAGAPAPCHADAIPLQGQIAASAYDNGTVPVNTTASARRLINDLLETHGDTGYPKGREFLARLDALETKLAAIANTPDSTSANPVPTHSSAPAALAAALEALIREAALANPALDFDKILCIRRKPIKPHANNQDMGIAIGLTLLNAYSEDTIPRLGWDNEIVLISNLRATTPTLTPIYRHPNASIIRDLDLHFDAQKILFAAANAKGNFAVFEKSLAPAPTPARELTPTDAPDTQWFDPCYLAEDDAILAFSTAGLQGVPCVQGSAKVAGLYRIENKPTTTAPLTASPAPAPHVRQLTFEQDSGWHPRTLNDGRIMYLRWQYTDTPHYFDRMLFTMLPDGRQQKALWGSGAYFPTALKHPRPVPGHKSMILGVVSGHHSLPEAGRLLLVDPNLGTHYPFRHDPKTKEWGVPGTHADIQPRVYPASVTGCVQEIPGWGRDVVGNICDDQAGQQKFTFLTPYALNEKYYLTSLWIDHKGAWGIYLADRFDNLVKILEVPGSNLFEPIPLLPRKRPPVIPDAVRPTFDKARDAIAAAATANPANNAANVRPIATLRIAPKNFPKKRLRCGTFRFCCGFCC